MTMGLWTPPGVVEEETIDLRTLEGQPGNMARVTKFSFRYKHKLIKIHVAHDEGASAAEIEDKAAAAYERRMEIMQESDLKRAPTAEEKKQIGKQMNDIRTQMLKRRESSNNRTWYESIEGVVPVGVVPGG